MKIIDAVSVEYHDKLNPLLWADDEMLLDVRVTLLKSAAAFVDFIDVPDLKLVAIHLTGSNASYNYTQYSDCDVHIVIDFAATTCPELAENFFMTKKSLWNETHSHVTVKGYKVELYPEDVSSHVEAAGVYDLLNGEWVKKPKREEPEIDSSAVTAKVDHLAHEIETISQDGDETLINDMFERLRNMRKAGLAHAGEFSTENLAFKTLRNLGYIDKLAQARLQRQDDDLTLEGACPICETPEGGLNRCTVQTVNAFANYYHFQPITRENEIPLYGAQVEGYLTNHGLKPTPEPDAVGKTVQQFMGTHRTGTHFISTDGHAMAVINGQLTDAAHQGADSRRIVSAIEFRR